MTCERCGESIEIGVAVVDWERDHHIVCAECYEYIMERYGATKVDPKEFEYDYRNDEGFPWEEDRRYDQPVRELCFE